MPTLDQNVTEYDLLFRQVSEWVMDKPDQSDTDKAYYVRNGVEFCTMSWSPAGPFMSLVWNGIVAYLRPDQPIGFGDMKRCDIRCAPYRMQSSEYVPTMLALYNFTYGSARQSTPTENEGIPDLDLPWIPMSDPVDIAHLAKTVEECGELIAALGRCLGQGINGSEPVTGKPNRQWLAEELADASGMAGMTSLRFMRKPEREMMLKRIDTKIAQHKKWFDQLKGIFSK